MNALRSSSMVLTVLSCAVGAGCNGGWQSRIDYIDNSVSLGARADDDNRLHDPSHGDVRRDYSDGSRFNRSQGGMNRIDGDGDGDRRVDRDGEMDDAAMDVDVAEPVMARDQARYQADVRNTLTALDREMDDIRARADQHGLAGHAAIEPHVRDLDAAHDTIALQMARGSSAGSDMETRDWSMMKTQIDLALDTAREAVFEADRALETLHTPTP